MRVQLARRGAVVALAAAAATVAMSMPASAAVSDMPPPHAYGVAAQVILFNAPINIGPLAESQQPNGAANASVASASNALLTASAITSTATLNAQGNSASAGLARLSLFTFPAAAPLISGSAITTSCNSTAGGTTTASTGTLTILGQTFNLANTQNEVVNISIPVGGFPVLVAKATINEKIIGPDGVVVNGLHIQALPGFPQLLSGDVVVAHSHCGPAAMPVPMASGAGMWVGLGLLGAIAVPVGAFGVRRRRSGAATAA